MTLFLFGDWLFFFFAEVAIAIWGFSSVAELFDLLESDWVEARHKPFHFTSTGRVCFSQFSRQIKMRNRVMSVCGSKTMKSSWACCLFIFWNGRGAMSMFWNVISMRGKTTLLTGVRKAKSSFFPIVKTDPNVNCKGFPAFFEASESPRSPSRWVVSTKRPWWPQQPGGRRASHRCWVPLRREKRKGRLRVNSWGGRRFRFFFLFFLCVLFFGFFLDWVAGVWWIFSCVLGWIDCLLDCSS